LPERGRYDAQAAYQRAIELGQAGGGSGFKAEDFADTFFGLGEALVGCAEQVTAACAALPDEQLSREAEQAARQRALGVLSDAIAAFRKVPILDPPTCLCEDAPKQVRSCLDDHTDG
jgi:hypothetical protein